MSVNHDRRQEECEVVMAGLGQDPLVFGHELRRRRQAAELSLSELAVLVHYSKGHLSKVETGTKAASRELARSCDAVLEASGALAAMAARTPSLASDGEPFVASTDGRDCEAAALLGSGLLAAAEATVAGWAEPPQDAETHALFWSVFDDLRRLGQRLAPKQLLPVVVVLAGALRTMAGDARHAKSFVLAARFAEYAGWMEQESGRDGAALRWTETAMTLARAAGDLDLAAYTDVRRALIALYRHDAIATIALARRVQHPRVHPRVRGLAAQREAQGHAVAGDYGACRRSLDEAAGFMEAAASAAPTGPVLGSSTVVDPIAAATGWCLHDLGRSAEAVPVLKAEVDRIPEHAHRAGARYRVRLALALASIREVEQACAVLDPILPTLRRVDSATVRTDLRQLARTLNRWHADATVRRVLPGLHLALHTTDSRSRPKGPPCK